MQKTLSTKMLTKPDKNKPKTSVTVDDKIDSVQIKLT